MTSETTKAQREQLIKDAYSLCRLDSAAPPDEVMELAAKYIEGRIELDDIADNKKHCRTASADCRFSIYQRKEHNRNNRT